MLKKGDKIPNVQLKDQNDQSVELHDLIGKPLVIYFYPKDNTKVCTAQACSFRDSYEDFKSHGAEVIGISPDSVGSHHKVVSKRKLPFVLLSDPEGRAIRAFKVPTPLFGLLIGRVTFVVDQTGTIQHTFRADFQAESHVKSAIRVLKTLK